MTEPTGHCPYLGLKQNRAIRFASPTPEHRCYIGGDPIEISVDQGQFCLSQNHVRCPLYTGLTFPSTTESAPPAPPLPLRPTSAGLRGWLGSLSPRDRLVYAAMLTMLAVIVAIYLVVGLQTFFSQGQSGGDPPASSASPAPVQTPLGSSPTTLPASPLPATATASTAIPTAIPPQPSVVPATVSASPTAASTSPLPATAIPSITPLPIPLPPDRATVVATIAAAPAVPAQPTLQATSAPTSAPSRASATAPVVVPPLPPLLEPSPTAIAQPVLPPGLPALPLPLPLPGQPVGPVTTSEQTVTLYFGDVTGSLYVPVQRRVVVENGQLAIAALRSLIAGPRNGLTALLYPDVQVLNLQIANGTATVNLNRYPADQGDVRGLYAIVFTLTELPDISRVQFQINGQNSGIDGSGPLARPALNPLNPDALVSDVKQTSFLPLYFLSSDGVHTVRLIRLVPKTLQTAESTLRALLEGPGAYAYAVQRSIPAHTEVRGLRLERETLIIDFTRPFADAAGRDAAIRTIIQSLTSLPSIGKVQFLVEGRSLAEWWGEPYGQVYGRQPINPD